MPVHPDVKSTVHAFEPQPVCKSAKNHPIAWNGEVGFVYSSRVFGRHKGRGRGKWVVEVGVVGMTVALQLPVAGDVDAGPRIDIIRGWLSLQWTAGVVKLPPARERLVVSW